MTDVTILLKQFTSRYQAALVIKAAVWGVLTLGVAGACWWRLHLLRLSLWWSAGVAIALSLASVSGLAWWLCQRWISVHDAANRLDNTLGLQQRLVTTLEFANTQPIPALYPQLVDDTTHVFASQKVRAPRPIDRTTVGVAIVLLLLLLWPFKGTEPIRLAGLPGMPPSIPPPKPDTPPPPQDQSRDQQSPSSSNQQDSPQPSSGGESPESGEGNAQQNRTNDQQQSSGEQPGQEQRPGSDEASEGESSPQADGRQGRQGAQQRAQQAGDHGEDQSGKGAQRAEATGQAAGDSGQQASQALREASSKGGGTRGLGNQDALKADIQQLLKELSGELKDLQQQLSAAEAQAREAGTSTDAQLYGDPEALDRTQGSSMPIQLKTDTAETTTARPGGGGAGKPSGEIGRDAPQMETEAAQLAEESLEDTTVTHQRVPPEYQSVFDRLYRRPEQPTETQQR